MISNSSNPTPEEVYYATEQYLPILPQEVQSQVDILLEQARSGKKVDNAILSLISDDEYARKWMRKALFGEDIARVMGSYDPLPGGPVSVPANSVWECRQCDFEWRVLRAGRPVPPCPRDYSVLVRKP